MGGWNEDGGNFLEAYPPSQNIQERKIGEGKVHPNRDSAGRVQKAVFENRCEHPVASSDCGGGMILQARNCLDFSDENLEFGALVPWLRYENSKKRDRFEVCLVVFLRDNVLKNVNNACCFLHFQFDGDRRYWCLGNCRYRGCDECR